MLKTAPGGRRYWESARGALPRATRDRGSNRGIAPRTNDPRAG